MTEADVAITDNAVSLEALFFLVMLARKECRRPDMRSWLAVFFASVSIASFRGGTSMDPRAGEVWLADLGFGRSATM